MNDRDKGPTGKLSRPPPVLKVNDRVTVMISAKSDPAVQTSESGQGARGASHGLIFQPQSYHYDGEMTSMRLNLL